MTTIEGGALVLNDAARGGRWSSGCASTASRACPTARATSSAPGGKYNLSDVSARLGLAQLARLDEWCRARERLAHALLRLPRGRRPAHARSACRRATNPGPQLEHVHRAPAAGRDGDHAQGVHRRDAARRHRHRRLLRGDPPHLALPRQGLARGAVPGLRAHRPRDGHAAALSRDDASRRGAGVRNAWRACCARGPRERHGRAPSSPSSSPSTTRRRCCPPSSRASTRRSTRSAAPTRSCS